MAEIPEEATQFDAGRESDSSQTNTNFLQKLREMPPGFRPVLICMTGSRKGARFKIEKKHTIMGRSRLSDFPLDETAASRRHARIIYDNFDKPQEQPVCFLEDLESRNGTEINGKEVTDLVPLKERDRIMIGHTILGYFVRDTAELLHDEFLYENAMKDALTGLDNRQQMTAHLKHFTARANRRRTEFCMLLVDVDHFKSVNDTYGHHIGDEALKYIARLMQEQIRETDFIARWGGEEFAIGVSDSTLESAAVLAERLRECLETHPLQIEGNLITLTVSIGATHLQEGDTVDTLFQRADKYLYEAKEAGRNRVVSGP